MTESDNSFTVSHNYTHTQTNQWKRVKKQYQFIRTKDFLLLVPMNKKSYTIFLRYIFSGMIFDSWEKRKAYISSLVLF